MPDDMAFWLCGGHYRFFGELIDEYVSGKIIKKT